MFRSLALVLVFAAVAIRAQTLGACQTFCNAQGPSATYCMADTPFNSVGNKSCFNLCVNNCMVDVSKCLDSNYACAIKKTPIGGNNDLKKSGCDKLFYPAWYFTTPAPGNISFNVCAFVAVRRYNRKCPAALPIVYINLMIFSETFYNLTGFLQFCFPFLVPDSVEREVFKWTAIPAATLGLIFYCQRIFMTPLMTINRALLTLSPTKSHWFCKPRLWFYNAIIASLVFTFAIIPLFLDCPTIFDIRRIAFLPTCGEPQKTLPYPLKAEKRSLFKLKYFGLVFSENQSGISFRAAKSRIRAENTLLIQAVAVSCTLLDFEITDKIAVFFSEEYQKLPIFVQHIAFSTRIYSQFFTNFTVYFIFTKLLRLEIIRLFKPDYKRKTMAFMSKISSNDVIKQ
ncbi:unnamed protein product [Caenorhabditis auriculariae]|uniref:Serpentine receptor class gamma n=1 Tax=Caenorhabditis auriculariae TaxID=2777116 RepID=A0A8S1H174_9PELO|nr:unnamed protein product [Caenorhabditis auriculariae]